MPNKIAMDCGLLFEGKAQIIYIFVRGGSLTSYRGHYVSLVVRGYSLIVYEDCARKLLDVLWRILL